MVLALVFTIASLLFFDSSARAYHTHQIIPAGYRHAWMTPFQEFFVAGVLAIMGLSFLWLWLSSERK